MFILEGVFLTTSCITGLVMVQQNCETSCTKHCLCNNVFRPKICNLEDSVKMYGTLQAKGKNLAWVNKAGF